MGRKSFTRYDILEISRPTVAQYCTLFLLASARYKSQNHVKLRQAIEKRGMASTWTLHESKSRTAVIHTL